MRVSTRSSLAETIVDGIVTGAPSRISILGSELSHVVRSVKSNGFGSPEISRLGKYTTGFAEKLMPANRNGSAASASGAGALVGIKLQMPGGGGPAITSTVALPSVASPRALSRIRK